MEVNWIEIIAAAVAAMVLGFLWYGPIFGKQWIKLSGMTEAKMNEAKKKGMTKSYAIMMVSALVMAYVLSMFIGNAGANTLTDGAMVGFLSWFGFAATIQLSKVLWGSDSWELYYLETGYYLVSLSLMGGIIGGWA